MGVAAALDVAPAGIAKDFRSQNVTNQNKVHTWFRLIVIANNDCVNVQP